MNQQNQTLDSMKNVIQELQAENKALRAGIADCQRYSQRWSLKVHGVKEKDGKDIRTKVLNILLKVRPKILDSRLKEGVDIVHCIGQRRQESSTRSIIVLCREHSFNQFRFGYRDN